VDDRSITRATRGTIAPMLKRILALPLMLLAAVPLLAGCSADSISAEGIAQAAATTSAKGGAKLSLRATVTVPGGPPITMIGSGVLDPQRKVGRIHMSFAGPAGVGGAMQQEMIVDGFTMYMRVPSLGAGLGSGKKWLKFDVAKAGKALGIDVSQMGSFGQDPSQSLQMLKAVAGDVKTVGEEDVRGVSTTHYSATIDLAKYPATVPATARAAVRRSVDQIARLTGTRTIPVDVWVDGDDVVRRFSQTLKMTVAGSVMQTKQTMELYDFGTKVHVQAPPKSEVQDLSDLAGGLTTG
jgi:hypothetical protein